MATVAEAKSLAKKLHGASFDARLIGYTTIASSLDVMRDQLLAFVAAGGK